MAKLKAKTKKKEDKTDERLKAFDFLNNGLKDKDKLAVFEEKEEIVVVPTILPGVNRAIVIGGYPMGTICECHGPNHGGKTVLGVAILRSFEERGHFGVFCDAERAANDKRWIENLGLNLSNILYFNPDHLEDAWTRINKIIVNFKEAKKKGKIPEDKCMFILVDSATKLVPSKFIKEGPGSGQFGLQALLLSNWLKTLTPLVAPKHDEKADIAIMFINQERSNVGAKPWESKYKSTCGEALQFDATVRFRVTYAGKVKEKINGEEIVVGKKHKVHVEKNKVGYPDSLGYFYTSNGLGSCPIGLDLARDTFEEALLFEVIEKDKNKFTSEFWDGHITYEKNVLEYLRENEDVLEDIRDELLSLVTSGKAKPSRSTSKSDDYDEDDDE